MNTVALLMKDQSMKEGYRTEIKEFGEKMLKDQGWSLLKKHDKTGNGTISEKQTPKSLQKWRKIIRNSMGNRSYESPVRNLWKKNDKEQNKMKIKSEKEWNNWEKIKNIDHRYIQSKLA